jgi:hypothetical protein
MGFCAIDTLMERLAHQSDVRARVPNVGGNPDLTLIYELAVGLPTGRACSVTSRTTARGMRATILHEIEALQDFPWKTYVLSSRFSPSQSHAAKAALDELGQKQGELSQAFLMR